MRFTQVAVSASMNQTAIAALDELGRVWFMDPYDRDPKWKLLGDVPPADSNQESSHHE